MTREEAIATLETTEYELSNQVGSKYCQKKYEAVKMAIKALEQEPCEELFDDWHEAPSYAMTLEQAREAVHELRKENVKLRKEPCEDAVSRQAVDQNIYDYAESNGLSYANLKNAILDAPSVTPTRKVGKWIYHEKSISTGFKSLRECSCCHCYFRWEMPRNSYCPNCGSDMRGSEGKE